MLVANTNNQAELLGKLSILFVEDDSEVRESMARYLSRRIGKVYTAHNGEAGLNSFKESHPDLVISDIRMGEMDGLEMCRAIREIDSDLPVIFISAHNESEILLSSIDLGVTKFIVKPVDTDLLMDTINDVAQSINEQHILEDKLQQVNETDFECESVVNYVSHFLDADRHDEFSFVRHLSIPKHGINGDFYSLAKHNGDVYVMLADGAGHGLAAVIPALPLPAIFQKQAAHGFSLMSMAAEINRTLHEQHLSEHFVATTLVRLNAGEGFVEILNCGNPPAFIIADDGGLLHTAHSKSTALGMIGSQEFFPEVERVSIEQDARIYLFTDGLVDTFFSSSVDAGDSELYSLFEPGQSEDVFLSIANRLEHAIQERNVDDVTLLEVRFEVGKQPTIKSATQPKPESARETETPVELDQLTLLYVEDDDLTREYLAAYLNRRVGMVYVAKNGEEGLSQFIQYRPQIVIADIKMPLMNGLVMAEEIRKLDKDVPIIVISGSDNAEDAEKMFEMGISRFHLKPLDPGRLTQTVQACIRQSNTLNQLRRAALAFEASSLAVVTADRNKQIISVNPAFSRITGYSLTEILGQSPSLLSPGRHDADLFHTMWNALEESGSWSGELLCQHKGGTTVPDWLTVNSVMLSGVLQGYNFIFSDITERQKNEEKLLQLTMHDGLTHLPNRSMFENRLNEQLVQVKQNDGKLAIVCINLDRFIEINNTLGVRVGDEVLFTVAQRLLNSAVGVDVVCRMGGDEFAVLMQGIVSGRRLSVQSSNCHRSSGSLFKLISMKFCFGQVSESVCTHPMAKPMKSC